AEALGKLRSRVIGVCDSHRLRCLIAFDSGGEQLQTCESAGGQGNRASGSVDGVRLIRRTESKLRAVEIDTRAQQVRRERITVSVKTVRAGNGRLVGVQIKRIVVVRRRQIDCGSRAAAGSRIDEEIDGGRL